jgi:hypothetical protein
VKKIGRDASGHFLAVAIFAGFAAVLGLLLITYPVHAQDNWIGRGAVHSAAGEWCCGIADCGVFQGPVPVTSQGYRLKGVVRMQSNGGWLDPVDETVPFSEAQVSPDGAFWRCKKPDGSRRCFFAPPPGS